MAQATGTTQTTQVTGTVQATGTTQATGATQATGTTQAVQPTCMTGQIAPDTTLSCTEDEQWTVQKGQTVSDLQLRGLVSRHTLETANPGVDFENLRVGQSVCIPKDNVPCELPETYTLAATETLEAVAMRFNLPVASLLRANPCLAPQDFDALSQSSAKVNAQPASRMRRATSCSICCRAACAESSSSSGAGGSSPMRPTNWLTFRPSASCMS